jgi:AraC family transcriptional regulator
VSIKNQDRLIFLLLLFSGRRSGSMEWSERMNAAIDYIENNLEGEVDLDEAADKAFCSTYHFQRMFLAVIGVTPAEYIRQRRLTLAAGELSSTDAKVIDVALKYGYNSPEAFTRAFRNLHGMTPTSVRESGVKITTYPRVSFHIELKGGKDMDYKIIEKPAFDLVGKSAKFHMKHGPNPEPAQFWKEYVVTREYQALWEVTGGKWGEVSEAPIMCAYLKNENGTWDPVVNAFGVEKPGEADTKNFEVFHIPAATYAEFWCTYETSPDTNKYIYTEWFPSTGYEHAGTPELEVYPPGDRSSKDYRCQYWLPVLKK